MVAESATAFLNQIAFVNAVLGGFAIALAVGLLALPEERRAASWAAGLALGSALALLLGTVAGTFGALWLVDRPELAGAAALPAEARSAVRWSFVPFLIGVYTLLASVGLSGWVRSRRLGLATAAAAAVVAATMTYVLVGVLGMV